MEIFNKTLELERFLAPFYQEKKTIGLVPTMGALHQGHLSLMKKALEENEVVVVSVFVNPTQFNNAEDLEKYPRNLERDAATIATLSDKIILFAPEVSQMYEGTPTSESYDGHGRKLPSRSLRWGGYHRRKTLSLGAPYARLFWRKGLSTDSDHQKYGRPAQA